MDIFVIIISRHLSGFTVKIFEKIGQVVSRGSRSRLTFVILRVTHYYNMASYNPELEEEIVPSILDSSTLFEDDGDMEMELSMSQIDCSMLEFDFDRKNEEVDRKKKEEEAKNLLIIQKNTLEHQNRMLGWQLERKNMEFELESKKLKKKIFDQSEMGEAARKWKEAVVMKNGAKKIAEWYVYYCVTKFVF